MSRQNGMTAEKIANLGSYRTSPLFTSLERACLAYADGLSQTPATVDDEVFAVLRTNFTNEQIVELTAAIAWEHYRARLNSGLGVDSDNFSEGAACAVPSSLPSGARTKAQCQVFVVNRNAQAGETDGSSNLERDVVNIEHGEFFVKRERSPPAPRAEVVKGSA